VKPQSADVYRLLRAHPEGVTAQDAIREIACYRLAARISDLKAEGIVIWAELVGSNGHRYARYHLVEQPVQMVVGL
jgi:hypothetical protein